MIRKLNTKFTFYTINTILILSFLYYFREPSLFFTLLVITGLFLLSTFFFSKQKEAFHIINYKKNFACNNYIIISGYKPRSKC